jgi:hypothetical protein
MPKLAAWTAQGFLLRVRRCFLNLLRDVLGIMASNEPATDVIIQG